MRECVIEPYGLARTIFQNGLGVPADVARGYALKGGTFPAVDSPRDVSDYWVDRSIASDVADVASFFRRLLRQHPEMLDQGLGIRTYDAGYGHGGTMAGYMIQLRASRDGGHIAIAATNSHSIPVLRALHASIGELF